MSALTHRQRAERAWNMANQLGPGPLYAKPDLIAREMFPAELVEAAKGIAHSDQYWTREYWDAALDELEAALALYRDQEEPDHE